MQKELNAEIAEARAEYEALQKLKVRMDSLAPFCAIHVVVVVFVVTTLSLLSSPCLCLLV